MTAQQPIQVAFIDTNVWLYALIKGQDPTKSHRARSVIATQAPHITISTQVINEVCVNLIKQEHFTPEQTRNVIIDFYARYTVAEPNQVTLVRATYLRERYSLSYWDSTIVASALITGASFLLSEDMQDGLVVEQQLTIVNPFK